MKNRTLKTKLYVVIAIFLSLFVFSYILSTMTTNTIIKNTDSIYKIRLTGIQNLVEADRDAYQSNIAINTLLLQNDSTSKKNIDGLIGDIEENIAQVDERYHVFIEAYKISGSEAHPEIEKTYNQEFEKLKKVSNKLIVLFKENKKAEAFQMYYSEYAPVFSTMRDALNQFTDISTEEALLEYNKIKSEEKSSKLTSIITLIILLLIDFLQVNSL